MYSDAELNAESLVKSAATLRFALELYESNEIHDPRMFEIVRDSLIKRFEYTYETSVAILKRYLKITSTDAEAMPGSAVPRLQDLVREGYAQGVLKRDWATWKKYREMRNRTVHIYDENTALLVIESAKEFLDEAEFFSEKLEEFLLQNEQNEENKKVQFPKL